MGMFAKLTLALLEIGREDVQEFVNAFELLGRFPERVEFEGVAPGKLACTTIYEAAVDVLKSPVLRLVETGKMKEGGK